MNPWRFCIVLISVFSLFRATNAATPKDPLAHWFGARTCPALDGLYSTNAHQPPYVKRGSDDLLVRLPQGVAMSLKPSLITPWYVYDPKAGVALRHIGGDSGVMETLRYAGKPPVRLPRVDLSGAHTASGLRLGDSSARVVRLLGKPLIIRACGMQRYEYTNNREGEPNDLDFTISHGRVIEIFRTSWG